MKTHTKGVLIFFTGLLFCCISCKKEEQKESYYFTFKIAGKTYTVDSLVYTKAWTYDGSASESYLSAKSTNGKYRVNVLLRNNIDSSTKGNYIISTLPQAIYPQKIIKGFGLTIIDSTDAANGLFSIPQADFSFTISDVNPNYISGSFNGQILGSDIPGGFSPIAYNKLITITDGKFKMPYTN